MPTLKLVIEYNGKNFHGWQRQPDQRTIQEELWRALSIVTRQTISPLRASGRTDAGVHAKGQVVSFKLPLSTDLGKLSRGVSHLLRGEVTVCSAEEVPDDFHPGIDATHKQYSYRVLNRDTPPVLNAHTTWHIPHHLDIERMREEARYLIGEHDFSSFRDSGCTATTAVKTIYDITIEKQGPELIFYVVGSGFLKQMVRNIVGTLTDIGRGRIRDKTILDILQKRDRRVAGVTAPAHGLTLDWVSYESAPEESSISPQALGCSK